RATKVVDQLGLAGIQSLGAIQVSDLVGHDGALSLEQLELVPAQGGLVLLIPKGVGVLHGGDDHGPEDELGNQLTGSGLAQGSVLHIVQDTQGLRSGSGADFPTGTGELIV